MLVLRGDADERTLAVLDRLAPGAHRCTPETVVVRSRGRLWVADEPDVALHLESAGRGRHVGEGGPLGDGTTEIVAITLGEPDDITAAFAEALLTDDELSFVDSIRRLAT